MKESTVRRRYSDFEWLRNELERESKVGKLKYELSLHVHTGRTDNEMLSVSYEAYSYIIKLMLLFKTSRAKSMFEVC